MTLSRRHFLTAGTSLGTLLAAGGLAGCASPTPRVTAPAPGVTRVPLGAVSAYTVSDGFAQRPLGEGFVRNAPLAAVQQALKDGGLPTDQLTIGFTPMVVDVGGQRVLFDTGNGEFGSPTSGKLLETMARAGMTPDSVTAVVVSHFHGDHINGLRNRAGALVFPKAKVFVPTPEWNFWMDDQRMAAAPDAMKGAFNGVRRVFAPIAQQVVRFEPGVEVLPGVRTVPAFGHTPGHTAFVVEGGGRKLMFWADAANIAALFVRNPDWAVQFDMDAEAARLTRRRLADQVIRENMLLAGYHLPGSAVGRLAVRGNGYEFTPLVA